MQTGIFWQSLSVPIIGLSPMDGLTDHPFRHIQKKYGNPAVLYTEFTSVEGVCHGATQLLKDFLYDETQRPIIAQVYGTTPSYFRQTAIVLCELGFDGIDINMGCPAKNVAHSGAGAALIQTPKLAQEIIRAVKAGISEWKNGADCTSCPDISKEIAAEVERRRSILPSAYREKREIGVSVKTRIGFTEPVIDQWIPTLLEMEPDAIALHGRTLKQQYGGAASWENIGTAAAIVHRTKTKILGNGDVLTREQAVEKVTTYGVDGVLIGRGSLGNPFVFQERESSTLNRFQIALEHAELYEATFGTEDRYNFLPMRKHLAWYVTAIPNAVEIRTKLVLSSSVAEVAEILKKYQLIP